jgi:hypothetical protein
MTDFLNLDCDVFYGVDPEPAITLLDVPEDVQVVHVTRSTQRLDLLPGFRNLRVLYAHDMDNPSFHAICSAVQIVHLDANIFGVTSIDELSRLTNLCKLELEGNTKISSIACIGVMKKLQSLSFNNCPVTIDLDALSACKELKYLSLSSRYAKAMKIASLAPLSALDKLERIALVNVRVGDKKLTPLHALIKLTQLELPIFFPNGEFAALAKALPNARGRWIDSVCLS